ncbi:MAG: hypothetical protein ACYC7E_02615 [Armatimonadota bacterium]
MLIATPAIQTDGASGADLAYHCHSAARHCVQEAMLAGVPADAVAITHAQLQQSLQAWRADHGESGEHSATGRMDMI